MDGWGGKGKGGDWGGGGCAKGGGGGFPKGGGGCAKGPGKGWGDDGWGGGGGGKSFSGWGEDASWGKGGGKGKDCWGGGGGDKGGWGGDKGGGKFGGDKGGWSPSPWDGGKGKMGKGKMGKDGKPTGKASQRIASGEPCHCGTLRSFFPDKNCGYIVSDEVYNQAGSEVYAFKKVLDGCGVGVGDLMIFFIHWSQRGQPQCSSPTLRLSNKNGYALKGTFKAGKVAEGEEGGYGFIECAATKDFFNRDIYVHKNLATGLAPGQTICFNVTVSKDWMPNAASLEPCDDAWEPTPADLSVQAEEPNPDGGPRPPGMWGKGGKDIPRKRPAQATGEVMTGALKSFNEKNNWGFIDCAEARNKWGKDVWVVGQNLKEPHLRQNGVMLHFEVALNEKGQPQATNISALGGAMQALMNGATPPPAIAAGDWQDAKRQKVEDVQDGFEESMNMTNDDVAAAIAALGFDP
mmetsp:Transcript_54024/g.139612  ORF Transcript_54024/g.139612 Transcript_54024/m.139612 type:complete len:462 (-) Transcript_54024:210-1595(-)